MSIDVNLKYKEFEKGLTKKIREGKIIVIEAQGEFHICSLCEKSIKSEMIKLRYSTLIKRTDIENECNIESECYAHDICYYLAKNPELLN